MCVCLVYVHICVPVSCASQARKGHWGPHEEGKMVVNCHVEAGKRPLVICKSSMCFLTTKPSFQPQ